MLCSKHISILIIFIQESWSQTVYNDSEITIIISDDYDKNHPPKFQGAPVMVYKAVQVMDLHSVRETTMDFKLDFYFVELWKDYRLKIHHHTPFPAVVPEEISKEFWTPESLFENAKSTVTSRLSEYSGQIKIFGDATIAQIAMHRVKVSCAMDLREYPMDLQVCVLKISMFKMSDNMATPAWPETAKNLPGSFKGVSIIGEIRLPQFELLSVVANKAVMVWETGNYTYLLPTFTFQRRIAFHICSTYLPSALVVVVSWVSFWLPIDAAPARVTLGVTSLLTLSTQMVQSYASLPPVCYVKALDIWMFVCILLVFTSLTEYAIAYYIFHNWTFPNKIVSCYLHKTKTETKKIKVIPKTDASLYCPKHHDQGSNVRSGSQKKTTPFLDKSSRLLFPLFFCIFNIGYWMRFLPEH